MLIFNDFRFFSLECSCYYYRIFSMGEILDLTVADRKARRLKLDRELQAVKPDNEPYKKLIKRMLYDVLCAQYAAEDSFIFAAAMKNCQLKDSLEQAINLLDNAYKLGLVTLKVQYCMSRK